MRTLETSLLVSAAAVLILGGAMIAWAEGKAERQLNPSSAEAVADVGAGEPQGISGRAQQISLDTCASAIQSLYGRLLPASSQEALLHGCSTAAKAVLRTAPTSSYAWYIGALTAAHLGNFDDMNRDIVMSQATAPHEFWLVRQRVLLSEDNLAKLDATAAAAEKRDLKTLLSSPDGCAAAAARVLALPEFQARMLPLVDVATAAEQGCFSAALQKLGDFGR